MFDVIATLHSVPFTEARSPIRPNLGDVVEGRLVATAISRNSSRDDGVFHANVDFITASAAGAIDQFIEAVIGR